MFYVAAILMVIVSPLAVPLTVTAANTIANWLNDNRFRTPVLRQRLALRTA